MIEDKEIKEFVQKMSCVPHIPRNVRNKEYKAKCDCGGTITAWRAKYNGHIRATCDKCGFKMFE